jgi:hypothetical protein
VAGVILASGQESDALLALPRCAIISTLLGARPPSLNWQGGGHQLSPCCDGQQAQHAALLVLHHEQRYTYACMACALLQLPPGCPAVWHTQPHHLLCRSKPLSHALEVDGRRVAALAPTDKAGQFGWPWELWPWPPGGGACSATGTPSAVMLQGACSLLHTHLHICARVLLALLCAGARGGHVDVDVRAASTHRVCNQSAATVSALSR